MQSTALNRTHFEIDIQKKFSLSYTWDKDKNCYIQCNGIPPRHNGVIPIKISGAVIATHTAYFLMDDSTPKGKDPNINIIDGIQKINGKTSVNILVSNYTNKHLTFTKENILDTSNQQS